MVRRRTPTPREERCLGNVSLSYVLVHTMDSSPAVAMLYAKIHQKENTHLRACKQSSVFTNHKRNNCLRHLIVIDPASSTVCITAAPQISPPPPYFLRYSLPPPTLFSTLHSMRTVTFTGTMARRHRYRQQAPPRLHIVQLPHSAVYLVATYTEAIWPALYHITYIRRAGKCACSAHGSER